MLKKKFTPDKEIFIASLGLLLGKELRRKLPAEAEEIAYIRLSKFIINSKLDHILKARGK